MPSLDEAGEILDELAAGWSRRLIDVMPTIGPLIFQRGFDPQIDYDESQVERMRAAMERHPGIFFWSHRSNLDTLVLAAAMQELGLPPAYLFAGINMALGPMGVLMRRAVVIFTGAGPATTRYISTCCASTSGTCSRSGSTFPGSIRRNEAPRTGRRCRRGSACCPTPPTSTCPGGWTTSCCCRCRSRFDQLHEISEYADYAQGGTKKPEGFGWLYGFIKAQGARHYGKIYVRFDEPVLMSSFLGPAGGVVARDPADADPADADPAGRRLALQKTAFEVAWRINQGMPVTATALVTTVLLAMQGAGADVRPDPAGAGRRDGLPGEPFGAADGER